ncbi:flagellar biosynthesis repressor FlbT [Pacificimonas flava]|uniref:Flagellar biosynthesis repressor FlbT n=2 Tax=Pacificimonas TaxID=1960290 RepID=A0A219B5Z2_9SPHN|nr:MULTISPECIES: flagellar biosynthesis repressor FlbT [Pacificimonas]MBZ6379221.1 flagellar biosynthesis repressor FlbT [Pacificimonas aurantium]OWV33563.1 flagellar biosynthesis repressor FlbT [Pacificimonas flava]
MTLRISLRDGEPVIINGALLRARGRTDFTLENQCTVLRGRDIMMPDQATSPARELYYCCQMAYVEPEFRQDHQKRLLEVLKIIFDQASGPGVVQPAVAMAQKVAQGDFYAALADCRQLMAAEDTLPEASEAA